MTESFTNVLLALLALPPAITAILDIYARFRSGFKAPRVLPSVSIVFSALLVLAIGYVLVSGGVGRATPFVAYYGEDGDLRVVGRKVDSPISLPNHIGCPDQTHIPVETALVKICGAHSTLHYTSIGQSGGAHCGFNVFAGVCVRNLFSF